LVTETEDIVIHRPTVLTRILGEVKEQHQQKDMLKSLMQYRPRDPDDYNLPDLLKAKVVLRIASGRRHESLIFEVMKSADLTLKSPKTMFAHHHRGFRLFIEFLRRNGVMVREARDGNSPLLQELQKKYDLELDSIYDKPKAKRKASR